MIGWSYSAALAAWTAKLAPGPMWAYWASSGPVQLVNDYWQYFEPVKEALPRKCSSDFVNIVEYIDDLLLSGRRRADVYKLKTSFGLQSLQHDDDFARYAAPCSFPLQVDHLKMPGV